MKFKGCNLWIVVICVSFFDSSIGNDSQSSKVQVHEIPGRGSDSCNLSPVAGFCLAYIPSYYYDAKIDRCRTFVYGGCGGNENRFQSETECGKFRYRCLRKRGRKQYRRN